ERGVAGRRLAARARALDRPGLDGAPPAPEEELRRVGEERGGPDVEVRAVRHGMRAREPRVERPGGRRQGRGPGLSEVHLVRVARREVGEDAPGRGHAGASGARASAPSQTGAGAVSRASHGARALAGSLLASAYWPRVRSK